MPALDWNAINTALTLSIAGYLWRQATKVDAIYQALFGVDGKNGLRARIEKLEDVTPVVSVDRMRAIEREQHYHGLVLHWIRNAVLVWAHENNIDLGKPPDRLVP